MKELLVNTSKPYTVYIENGLRHQIADMINNQLSVKGKPVVITDQTVYGYYKTCIHETLNAFDAPNNLIVIPQGEEQKSIERLGQLYETLAEKGVVRDDFLIAMGGGVIGDLTGFVAATFLRGIDFIQIPTTLLADVDSSVGGKTAINLKAGKNMAGAFYQPAMVLIDPEFINTLPPKQVACGMAEVIKTAAIQSAELFEKLKGNMDYADMIEACCQIKINVVVEDERDKGLRMILNFGHTAAHGIEKLAGYGTMTHGHAVGIGMQLVANAGEATGKSTIGIAKDINEILTKYHLPTQLPQNILLSDVIEEMKLDKKNIYGKLNLITLKAIGEAEVVGMSFDEVVQFYRTGNEAV